MRTVVVARYNETLSWVNPLSDWQPVVYNKGAEYPGLPAFKPLPNVGREANAYLIHIVENYDSMSGEIVFCQGNPFDHDPDFIAHISDDSIRHYGMVMDCTPDGGPHMADAFLHEYCRIFDLPIQPLYRFVAGAQFRVRKEQITARTLAFYEGLLAITNINPRSPYSLERLWPTIFGIEL